MKVGNKHPTGVIVVCMKITGLLAVTNKWQVCYTWHSLLLSMPFLAGCSELHWDGKQSLMPTLMQFDDSLFNGVRKGHFQESWCITTVNYVLILLNQCLKKPFPSFNNRMGKTSSSLVQMLINKISRKAKKSREWWTAGSTGHPNTQCYLEGHGKSQ